MLLRPRMTYKYSSELSTVSATRESVIEVDSGNNYDTEVHLYRLLPNHDETQYGSNSFIAILIAIIGPLITSYTCIGPDLG